jgi:hypothetical protein
MIVPIAANAVPSAQPATARLHDELFPVIAGDFVTYRRGMLALADVAGDDDRSAVATTGFPLRSQKTAAAT